MPENIDESADFEDLIHSSEPLKMDFIGLKAINSYGVRNLIKFIREWEPRKFEFHNCPIHFVRTLNVIKALLGTSGNGACVRSFYAPFHSESCEICTGASQDILLLPEQIAEKKFPEVYCGRCNVPLDPEEPAPEYLEFLQPQR